MKRHKLAMQKTTSMATAIGKRIKENIFKGEGLEDMEDFMVRNLEKNASSNN